jgi:superfamily II DNA or RNA helicase
MKHNLRDYQDTAVNHAAEWLATAGPSDRRCYAAPTGTGKSVMELALQARVPGSWIVTPKVEIAAGLLDKAGLTVPTGERALLDAAAARSIFTPIRLRNALLRGGSTPPALILDEGHHDLAESYQQLHALCHCPAVCFTATPYRGTPKGTAAFREQWGEPVWVLTYPEAIARGVISFPVCKMLPLVDDDIIDIANGELVASQVTSATKSRLADLVEACRGLVPEDTWDRPTMFACPGTDVARDLAERLAEAGLPSRLVTGETPHMLRQHAFEDCLTGVAALVQVAVVSEGVDLPIRRLIDLAPSISPVRWLQQLGRITRPVGEGESAPEYICTNRNLFRHAYLLDGCLPQSAVQAAQNAFPAPPKRAGLRVVGLEAIGRLKACQVPLRGGMVALLYAMSAIESNRVKEYCVIVHPMREEPIWACRENERKDGSTSSYGRWRACSAPEDVTGYASVNPRPVSEKQQFWWVKGAGAYGLDPGIIPDRKQFVALPVLSDLRVRL